MPAPFLPFTGLVDQQQVLDAYGVIWEYDANTNTFLNRGVTKSYPDVSELVDGFVPPALFRKLELLNTLIDNGYDFSQFKIKTSSGLPYFYYLRSRNDLIKYVPEAQNRLRIEIDRNRLYQKLVGVCCVGPKGRTGAQGARGAAGIPAPNEVMATPITKNGKLHIDAIVPTPIDTPISLRFFSSDIQQIELLIALDGTTTTTSTTIEMIDPSFVVADGKLVGSVGFNIDTTGWRFKARQRGQKGKTGTPGYNFLEIVPQLLDDPSLVSKQAVVSIRKSGDTDVRVLTRQLPEAICVSNLASFDSDTSNINPLTINLVAVEVTTRSCKDIGYFGFDGIPNSDITKDTSGIVAPPLDLPTWAPAPGCGQRSRWGSFNFEWWNNTDLESMFRVMSSPKPPEACCEQDFFMCPNVGDTPCGAVDPTDKPPTIIMPEPFPGDCTCECENPNESKLRMGQYIFGDMDLKFKAFSDEKFISDFADSVIDGSNDQFVLNVLFDGPSSTMINIIPMPDICGGAKERESCAYKELTSVNINASISDVEGGTRIISSPTVEVPSFPSVIEFTYEPIAPGAESKVKILISVNTTRLNYCRGYRITVVSRRAV